MQGVPAAPSAIFPELDPVSIVLPVLLRGVVPPPAVGASQRDFRPIVRSRHLDLPRRCDQPPAGSPPHPLVAAGRIEPPDQRLRAGCSTRWLRRPRGRVSRGAG